MKTLKSLGRDSRGDAVVEATILFPIIIMIFAGLVLLSMYLPARGSLQRATQYAATALATERSDTWLRFDPGAMEYYWEDSREDLGNVYMSLFRSMGGNRRDDADNAAWIVQNIENKSVVKSQGDLTVQYGVVNYIIYKEIIVTATQTIPMPVDLSFVMFPKEIEVTVTSTAVVQNGDEFVRNLDLAADFMAYIADKYQLNEVFDSVGELCSKFSDFLGL